jgi:histidinol-phosphate aminotransferase
MKIFDLVQKEVRDLSCYEVKTILGQKNQEKIIKMNLNENFAISTENVKNLLFDACQKIDIRAYPPPRGILAVRAISNFFHLKESQVAVANGADEIMDLLMKVFVRKGSKVIVAEPTFPMYTFFTELYGGKKVAVLLKKNFNLDIQSILKMVDKKTRLLFICSPNNPTGNQFRESDIIQLLKEFRGIVVVDEAYVDFAENSTMNLINNFDNLAILRSFSKSFGLAGLRLGYIVSSESVIKYIRKVVGPFNVNTVTQQTVVLALQKWDYFKQKIKLVIDERNWILTKLREIQDIEAYHSDANFILFKVTNSLSSKEITERLEKRNILVKDRGHLPLLENCIRVTIGTRNMNKKFVSALKESLEY